MTPTIRGLEEGDVEHLAPRLRHADKDEIRAGLGLEPLAGLRKCVSCSVNTYVIEQDGTPCAIMGDSPDSSTGDGGVIWGFSTAEFAARKGNGAWFARTTKAIIEKLSEPYEVVWGLIDTRNKAHIRWLEWAGFTFGRVVTAGPDLMTFQFFWRNKIV